MIDENSVLTPFLSTYFTIIFISIFRQINSQDLQCFDRQTVLTVEPSNVQQPCLLACSLKLIDWFLFVLLSENHPLISSKHFNMSTKLPNDSIFCSLKHISSLLSCLGPWSVSSPPSCSSLDWLLCRPSACHGSLLDCHSGTYPLEGPLFLGSLSSWFTSLFCWNISFGSFLSNSGWEINFSESLHE